MVFVHFGLAFKMMQSFVILSLGVDGGSDIKRSLLVGIYKRIAKEPLQPNDDHTSKVIAVDNSVTGLHKPVFARFTYLFTCFV